MLRGLLRTLTSPRSIHTDIRDDLTTTNGVSVSILGFGTAISPSTPLLSSLPVQSVPFSRHLPYLVLDGATEASSWARMQAQEAFRPDSPGPQSLSSTWRNGEPFRGLTSHAAASSKARVWSSAGIIKLERMDADYVSLR